MQGTNLTKRMQFTDNFLSLRTETEGKISVGFTMTVRVYVKRLTSFQPFLLVNIVLFTTCYHSNP